MHFVIENPTIHHRLISFALLAPVLFCALVIAVPAPAQDALNVTSFGAVGDGKTDDTAAIQRAIHAAEAAGGGTVYFPTHTYLLNSTSPAHHPWMFYNLIAGSNVTLIGERGAKLLQGPGGRHALVEGASHVRNTVLAFGPDFVTIRFQNTKYNGGFHSLKATQTGKTTVALERAADTARFAVGDYVAIYAQTTGDVIPTETSRIQSVDGLAGTLELRTPLARSFATPWIANVTPLATTNVAVKNLIIQGTEPLAATECFGFTAENCQFILDTSVGGHNTTTLNLNTLNGFRFTGNVIACTGPIFPVVELAQRNSQNGIFEANTFEMRQGGMGEYAAHWKFIKNRFTLHPDEKTNTGLAVGGLDIEFSDNIVESSNLTAGGGYGSLLADYLGPKFYASYVGHIRILRNVFSGQADGNACLGLYAPDTEVSQNRITLKGSATGIHAEGPLPQTLNIQNNTITVETGRGIVIAGAHKDGSIIRGNTLTGKEGSIGIQVSSPPAPNEGGHVITQNTIHGFKTPLSIDKAKHPGSQISEND